MNKKLVREIKQYYKEQRRLDKEAEGPRYEARHLSVREEIRQKQRDENILESLLDLEDSAND